MLKIDLTFLFLPKNVREEQGISYSRKEVKPLSMEMHPVHNHKSTQKEWKSHIYTQNSTSRS